ncbi:MAG: hypothetical protein KF696_14190 [Planctomycetes bacterium]|nr:hypothetical protein [Planctomycetota bacterium]MCW8136855.1 hypothetical protein [Planctomycetota bacterium]
MKYAILGLLFLAGCTATSSGSSSSKPSASKPSVRGPSAGASAGTSGASASANKPSASKPSVRKPNYPVYKPPVIRSDIGNTKVTIDPKCDDVWVQNTLGPFFVESSSGGVKLKSGTRREDFSGAVIDAGLSAKIDNDGVHVAQPNAKVHNDHIGAGLRNGHFDVIWKGATFERGLSDLNDIAGVRLDASADESGFKASAVPKIHLKLVDVSADYAVHRFAAHAGLTVYVEASNKFVLAP